MSTSIQVDAGKNFIQSDLYSETSAQKSDSVEKRVPYADLPHDHPLRSKAYFLEAAAGVSSAAGSFLVGSAVGIILTWGLLIGASFAFPVGLGLLAGGAFLGIVAITAIALRHLYIKKQGVEPNTAQLLREGLPSFLGASAGLGCFMGTPLGPTLAVIAAVGALQEAGNYLNRN